MSTKDAKTIVLSNRKQVYENLARFFDNAKSQVLAYLSPYTFTLTTEIDELQAPKRAARKRGVTLRYITDITKENLEYCKRQVDLVDELRHLGGVRGNFILSESEYLASPDLSDENPLTNAMYTNLDHMLKQQWYIFETLWKYSVPAEVRFKEIDSETPSDEDEVPTIDRIYECQECGATFIFGKEAEEHSELTGHKKRRQHLIGK